MMRLPRIRHQYRFRSDPHFGSSAMLKFDRVSSMLLTLSMAKVQLSERHISG